MHIINIENLNICFFKPRCNIDYTLHLSAHYLDVSWSHSKFFEIPMILSVPQSWLWWEFHVFTGFWGAYLSPINSDSRLQPLWISSVYGMSPFLFPRNLCWWNKEKNWRAQVNFGLNNILFFLYVNFGEKYLWIILITNQLFTTMKSLTRGSSQRIFKILSKVK